MGIESILGSVAAPLVGSVVGGLFGGNKQSGTTTNTQQQTLDPRIQALLYGDGTSANPGILNQAAQAGSAPRSAGSAAFGAGTDQWLGSNGANSLAQQQATASNLMGSNISAPQSTAAQSAAAQTSGAQANAALAPGVAQVRTATSAGAAPVVGSVISAPGQNNLDLSTAYGNVIDGNAGANPYLTSALQSAVNTTNDSYNQNQTSLTNQLQRTILPQINQSAALSGQYGGTRQGIAQGNALSDYTNQLTQANQQLADTNSANTTGQQAAAYNAGQDRSLSALNTLSGQQYGVASQNAQLGQQAALANAQMTQQNNQYNAGNAQASNLANAQMDQQNMQYNAGNQQQTNLANAGYQQQANLANSGYQQQANLANSGYQQQTGLANQAAQGTTNQLNSANQATGINAASGILGNAYNYSTANDMYGLNKAGQTAGILAPFTGLGATSSASSPYYTNTLGNVLGGATAGLGLYNAYNSATKSPTSSASNLYAGLGIDGY